MTPPTPASATKSTEPVIVRSPEQARIMRLLNALGSINTWDTPVDGRSVQGLVKRGLVELDGHDLYLARAAATPPAAVTSDLAFDADTLEEEVPLGPELDIDSIADYEAAQVSEAMRLITIRETNWYSDKVVRNQAIKELALIDGHWIMDAEAALKAQAVTDQTHEQRGRTTAIEAA